MTMNTFSPVPAPSPGTDRKPKPKLLETEFGDGYTQASADGINWIRDTVNLSWETLLPTQANAIDAFFVGQGGYIPFLYTISDETTAKQWICKVWTVKRGSGGIRSMTATLVQDFSIGN
jgi:phage-related protein